jgi:hypothetical protein
MGVGVRKGPSSSDEAEKELDWKALIISDSEDERRLSQRVVIEDRQDTIRYLRSVLARPIEQGEPFYGSSTARNIAISLLGKLRAAEAAADLATWLRPRPGQGLKVTDESAFGHAGEALIEIGLPSVRPLLELLRIENNRGLQEQCLKIMVRIKGLRETELLFEDVIAAESDAAKRDNLEAAQALLEGTRIRKILEKLDKRRIRL